MDDPPEIIQAIENAVRCINATKTSRTHHLNYAQVRGLAVGVFQDVRRGNPEATLIDGIAALVRRDCPGLFKEEPKPVSQPQPKPEQKVEPLTKDEELLRRFHRMKSMSDLEEEYKRGNIYKSVSDAVWESSLRDRYKILETELNELGGPLTRAELEYVYKIPDGVMKVNKLKVLGLGKSRCEHCGLPKKK
jgi:hypothetical protein